MNDLHWWAEPTVSAPAHLGNNINARKNVTDCIIQEYNPQVEVGCTFHSLAVWSVAPWLVARPSLKAQCESRKKLRSQQTRDRWLTWMFIRVFFAKTHFILSPPSLVCLAHGPVYKPSMAIKTRPLQNSLPSFVIQTFMDWWRRDEGAT